MKNRKMILERLLIRRLTDLSSCWKGTPLPFHLPMSPWAKHSVSKWVSDLWHTVWTAVSEPQCVNGTLGSPFLSLIIVKKRNALLYCVGKEQHNSYTELKKKKIHEATSIWESSFSSSCAHADIKIVPRSGLLVPSALHIHPDLLQAVWDFKYWSSLNWPVCYTGVSILSDLVLSTPDWYRMPRPPMGN